MACFADCHSVLFEIEHNKVGTVVDADNKKRAHLMSLALSLGKRMQIGAAWRRHRQCIKTARFLPFSSALRCDCSVIGDTIKVDQAIKHSDKFNGCSK